jgi:hypothetical protein
MRLIYLLLILTIPFKVSAQIKPADQQYIPQENLLLNPGYEQGRVNWTISGTATVSLEQTASAVLAGLSSLKIVASSQTFEVAQFTTKSAASLNGMQAMASVRVKTNQSGVQVCSIENSVHVKCVNVDSTNQTKEYIIPFVFNSTNNGIVIKGASGTGTTYIDDAYVGIMPANMMPEVSQAQIAVEAYFVGTTSCTWARSSASIGSFATTAACPGPTILKNNVGQALSTDSDLPRVSVNNLPAGDYIATFQTPIRVASGQNVYTAITDGSTNCSANLSHDSASRQFQTISCAFSYTSSGNRSFELLVASSGAAVTIDNNITSLDSGLKFILEYYPPKSKIYSGDTIYPHAQIAGEAFIAGTASCDWSRASTTLGAFGTTAACPAPTIVRQNLGQWQTTDADLPRFTVNNLPIGEYEATFILSSSGNGANRNGLAINDGTTTCVASSGIVTSGAVANTVISCTFKYDQVSNRSFEVYGAATGGAITINNSNADILSTKFILKYFPPKDNPIIGTFEGIEKCEDDFECTDVFSAKVSSAGVVSDENLNWINGNCTFSAGNVCSFNSGIFTVTPNCWLANTTTGINQSNVNGGQVYNLSTTGATFGSIDAAGGAIVARNQTVYCQKQGSDYKPKTAKAATTNEMMYVPNVTRPKTCYYAFGGASATLAAPTVCAASPCVEVVDNCSAGTAPTRASAGLYNDLTFATGTWKANSLLDCQCRSYRTVSGDIEDCLEYFVTGDNTWSTNASGGAVLNINNGARDGTARDAYVRITCTADAP